MENTASNNTREGLYVDAVQVFNMLEYLKKKDKNNGGKVRAYNKVAKMIAFVAQPGVLILKKQNEVKDAEYQEVPVEKLDEEADG